MIAEDFFRKGKDSGAINPVNVFEFGSLVCFIFRCTYFSFVNPQTTESSFSSLSQQCVTLLWLSIPKRGDSL